MWKQTWIVVACAVATFACGNSNNGDDDDDFTNIPCNEETRDDDYVAGLEKIGLNNLVKAALDDAAPAPPDVGDNEWTVTIRDNGNDSLLDGCTFDAITPWMPDHNHGTSPQPIGSAGASSGEYDISQLNLFMGGLWEITFDVTCQGMQDTFVYTFCVEG